MTADAAADEPDWEELLTRAYLAYNGQDVEALLALVGDDVDWPDGSGRLRGRAAVRAYWTKQWTRTRTRDRPVAFTRRPDGRVEVRVSQVVRSLDGSVISTGSFCHVHRIEGHCIVRMDIVDVVNVVDVGYSEAEPCGGSSHCLDD